MSYYYATGENVLQDNDEHIEEEPNNPMGWDSTWSTLVMGLLAGLLANMLSRVFTRYRAAGPPAVDAPASSSMRFSDFSVDNKMVLVIRTDLGMTKGKVAAQCAHAAVGCYRKALSQAPQLLKQWETFGQTKITLKVNSQEEILALKTDADAAGLVNSLVRDAGRTQIEAGSITVLGIGPAPSDRISKISGHLKLY